MAKKKTTSKKTKKVATKKVSTKKTATKSVVSKKTTKTSSTNTVLDSLRKWNLIAASLLLLQGVAILVISKSVTIPVHINFLAKNELASQAQNTTVLTSAYRHLFDLHVASLVAAFLLVSALIFGLVSTIKRSQYEAGLKAKINTWRWTQYAFTAGLMLLTVALLNGVYDLASLIMIFALVCGLHFLNYITESVSKDKKTMWQAFTTLCGLGAIVWIAVGLYLKEAVVYGNGLPVYVYWIDGTIFALTLALGLNKLMILKARGRWADYIFGERVFILLSTIGASALAWQVFFGSLRP